VAKAPGDGFTLLVVPAGFSANPSIYPNLPFDQKKDLTGISLLASGPLVLVVNPNVKAKNTRELIHLLKSKPDEFNYGSAGVGSLPHLTAELFNLEAGTKMLHIPYKGAGPAVIDLLAGIVPIYFMNILQAKPLIAEGSIRAPRSNQPFSFECGT
jgi:tripartite-type tricarboxylate transporter receptor subunit TctC